ncbi:MAG: hypothetical protein JWN34_5933, partial [Bryobacterales bacterium]|nr:hypothetical protein [Bryobacterales bacterium]
MLFSELSDRFAYRAGRLLTRKPHGMSVRCLGFSRVGHADVDRHGLVDRPPRPKLRTFTALAGAEPCQSLE